MTVENTEPTLRFTDEEAAFLRYARFGELPPRVRPDDLVEVVETEQPWFPSRRQFDLGPQGPLTV